MGFDTGWDPETYRTPFESDEHWKLKLDFIEAHKEKFPEDKLICLAQVFVNVELMGCKYPDKVMERVGILAEDFAANYQASRENKVKRTVASAKDAAEAKVRAKASRKTPSDWGEKQKKKVFTGPVAFVKAGADGGDDEDEHNSMQKLKAGVTYCSEDQSTSEPLWMKQQRDDSYHNQEDRSKPMIGFGNVNDNQMPNKQQQWQKPQQSTQPQLAFVKSSTTGAACEDVQNAIPKITAGVNYCSIDQSSSEPLWMKQQRDERYYDQEDETKHKAGFGNVQGQTSPHKNAQDIMQLIANQKQAFVKASAKCEAEENGKTSTPMDQSSSEPLWMKQQRDERYHNQGDQAKHMTGFGNVQGQASHKNSQDIMQLIANQKLQSQQGQQKQQKWPEPPDHPKYAQPKKAFVKSSATFEADDQKSSPMDQSSSEPLWMKQQRDEQYHNQQAQSKLMAGLGNVPHNQTTDKKAQGINPQWQRQHNESQSWQSQQGQQRQHFQKQQQYNQSQQPGNKQLQQHQQDRQQASGSGMPQGRKVRQAIKAPTPEREPPPPKNQPGNRQQNQPGNRQQNQPGNRQQLPNQRNKNDPLSSFILVTRKYRVGTISSLSIINDSVTFNGKNVKYNYSFESSRVVCKLFIGDNLITTAKGECKKSAKDAAADQALLSLRSRCLTLQVLKKHVGDESVTTDLVVEGGGTNNPLPEDNFGSKLLKMMGWSGGGLGKHGTGIAEPIKAEAVMGRQGLGHKAAGGVTHDFKQSIKKIIQDYVSTNQNGDLIFSSDFSKEQRAEIHAIARRMNLKSASTGSGANRFLAISRRDKLGKVNILQEVLKMGGETEKYKLLKPGEMWDDEDIY